MMRLRLVLLVLLPLVAANSLTPKRFAFVILYASSGEREFGIGAITLARSLIAHHPELKEPVDRRDVDMVALVSEPGDPITELALEREGYLVLRVPKLPNPYTDEAQRRRKRLNIEQQEVFTKLRIWEALYPKYYRALYIDTDTIVVNNLRDAFRCGKFCAKERGPDSADASFVGFNAGVLLIEPSKEKFEDMGHAFKIIPFTPSSRGDQGFLHQYHYWWCRDGKNLTSMASPQDARRHPPEDYFHLSPEFASDIDELPTADPTPLEGPCYRLPGGYNFIHKEEVFTMAWSFSLTESEISNLKIAHFTHGKWKPWIWYLYPWYDFYWTWYRFRPSALEDGFSLDASVHVMYSLAWVVGGVFLPLALIFWCFQFGEKKLADPVSLRTTTLPTSSIRPVGADRQVGWLGALFGLTGVAVGAVLAVYLVPAAIQPLLGWAWCYVWIGVGFASAITLLSLATVGCRTDGVSEWSPIEALQRMARPLLWTILLSIIVTWLPLLLRSRTAAEKTMSQIIMTGVSVVVLWRMYRQIPALWLWRSPLRANA